MEQSEEYKQLANMVNELTSRADLIARLGKMYQDDRDIYKALGWNAKPTFDDYLAKYTRQDISKAIIDRPVDACWRKSPDIIETEDADSTAFETAWTELLKEKKIFHYLRRADRLTGIGKYGVLFMGFDDVKEEREFKNPVSPGNRKLLYLRPYMQCNAEVNKRVSDVFDERYGLPEEYKIKAVSTSANSLSTSGATSTKALIVHHTRVLHLAEDLLEDDENAEPKLKSVLNLLDSLQLVVGGSAEMFWRGAFPGLNFKMDKDARIDGQTIADMQTQIKSYMHKLQRHLRLQGVDVEQLAPQVADPSNHFDILVTLISATTGIPKRILLGSERGELASSQDQRNWNEKVDERRTDYVEPMILRPFIDKMIEYGVLPEPKEGYTVKWPELSAPSEKEKMDISKTKTDALVAYSNSPSATLVMPPDIFLRQIMSMSQEDLDALEKSLEVYEKEVEEERKEIEASGGVGGQNNEPEPDEGEE